MASHGLQSYHIVWLASHPHRDSEWLLGRLLDGFDIHHIDGNHANDVAENLVLIECVDHMMLHGCGHKMLRLMAPRAKPYIKAAFRKARSKSFGQKMQADERLALFKSQRESKKVSNGRH